MSEEEQFQFCGTVCMAARRLGIYCRFQDGGFMWFDPMARYRWKTEPAPTKKEALVKACESLTNYLWVNQKK